MSTQIIKDYFFLKEIKKYKLDVENELLNKDSYENKMESNKVTDEDKNLEQTAIIKENTIEKNEKVSNFISTENKEVKSDEKKIFGECNDMNNGYENDGLYHYYRYRINDAEKDEREFQTLEDEELFTKASNKENFRYNGNFFSDLDIYENYFKDEMQKSSESGMFRDNMVSNEILQPEYKSASLNVERPKEHNEIDDFTSNKLDNNSNFFVSKSKTTDIELIKKKNPINDEVNVMLDGKHSDYGTLDKTDSDTFITKIFKNNNHELRQDDQTKKNVFKCEDILDKKLKTFLELDNDFLDETTSNIKTQIDLKQKNYDPTVKTGVHAYESETKPRKLNNTKTHGTYDLPPNLLNGLIKPQIFPAPLRKSKDDLLTKKNSDLNLARRIKTDLSESSTNKKGLNFISKNNFPVLKKNTDYQNLQVSTNNILNQNDSTVIFKNNSYDNLKSKLEFSQSGINPDLPIKDHTNSNLDFVKGSHIVKQKKKITKSSDKYIPNNPMDPKFFENNNISIESEIKSSVTKSNAYNIKLNSNTAQNSSSTIVKNLRAQIIPPPLKFSTFKKNPVLVKQNGVNISNKSNDLFVNNLPVTNIKTDINSDDFLNTFSNVVSTNFSKHSIQMADSDLSSTPTTFGSNKLDKKPEIFSNHHIDQRRPSVFEQNERQIAIFQWTPNQNIVYCLPDHSSNSEKKVAQKIVVNQILNIVKINPTCLNFPGPFNKLKTKKKDIEKWIGANIEKFKKSPSLFSNELLLNQFFLLALKYNGDIKSTSFIKSFCSTLNLDLDKDFDEPFVNSTNSNLHGSKLNTEDFDHISNLIFSGKSEKALNYSIKKNDWSFSFLIANFLGNESYLKTVATYLSVNFKLTNLKTVNFGLMKLLLKIINGNCQTFFNELEQSEEINLLVSNWKKLVSIILINNFSKQAEFLCEFGKFLSNNNNVYGAQICFMLAGLPLSHLPLNQSNVKFFHIVSESGSFFYTEIYEYTLSLNSYFSIPVYGFPHLLSLKLRQATLFADYSMFNESQKYVDVVNSVIKSLGNKSIFINAKLLRDFQNLIMRLTESGSTDSGWFGSKITKVNLDKVWGQLDKFINGNEKVKVTDNNVFSKFSPSTSRETSTLDLTGNNNYASPVYENVNNDPKDYSNPSSAPICNALRFSSFISPIINNNNKSNSYSSQSACYNLSYQSNKNTPLTNRITNKYSSSHCYHTINTQFNSSSVNGNFDPSSNYPNYNDVSSQMLLLNEITDSNNNKDITNKFQTTTPNNCHLNVPYANSVNQFSHSSLVSQESNTLDQKQLNNIDLSVECSPNNNNYLAQSDISSDYPFEFNESNNKKKTYDLENDDLKIQSEELEKDLKNDSIKFDDLLNDSGNPIHKSILTKNAVIYNTVTKKKDPIAQFNSDKDCSETKHLVNNKSLNVSNFITEKKKSDTDLNTNNNEILNQKKDYKANFRYLKTNFDTKSESDNLKLNIDSYASPTNDPNWFVTSSSNFFEKKQNLNQNKYVSFSTSYLNDKSFLIEHYKVDDDTVKNYFPISEYNDDDKIVADTDSKQLSSADNDTKKKNKQIKQTTSWLKWFSSQNNGVKPIKAKLGEKNNTFYYDENLKRWFDKKKSVKEQLSSLNPLPPPKMETTTITSTPDKSEDLNKNINDKKHSDKSDLKLDAEPSNLNLLKNKSPGNNFAHSADNVSRPVLYNSNLNDLLSSTKDFSALSKKKNKKPNKRNYVNVMEKKN